MNDNLASLIRNLQFHLSGLAALMIFLNRLWNGATFEETIFGAVMVGLSVYLMLLIVDITINRIMQFTPSFVEEHTDQEQEEASAGDQEEKKEEPKEKVMAED